MGDAFCKPRTSTILSGCAAALVAAAVVTPPALAGAVKARPAAEFVDMFGVVVHISRGTGVLDEQNWPTVEDAIVEAGFRTVRTTLTKTDWIPRAQGMAARGLRFNLRIDSRPLANGGGDAAQLDPGRIPEMLAMAKEVGVDAILSFEGPNEYNAQQSDDPPNPDWAVQLAAFMAELKEQVTADEEIADKPIVAPSIWRRKVEDYQAMAALDVAAHTTKGNLHNYNGGRLPDHELSARIADAQIMTGNQPIWVTEYGYRTHGPERVSEEAKARYLPRYAGLLFDDARVERAYNFQIVDEWPAEEKPDKTWGLLDNDLARRPAFYAVKNTLSLLGEGDPGFGGLGTGSLDYELAGASTAIRHFLVQKGDGRFYLGLWQEVESFSQETGTDVAVAPQDVTVTFTTPVASATTYLPTALHVPAAPEDGSLPVCLDGADPACDGGTYDTPSSIDLPVPDELVIVEIVRIGDALSPTVPADLTAKQGSRRRVTVSWDPATDNAGVAAYRLYDGGVLEKNTVWTSYTFFGQKGRRYEFAVSAVDAAGNESARSEPVVLTVK